MLQDVRARRDEIELLGCHLADARELAAARARLLIVGDVVLDSHARQRRIDRLPLATLARVCRDFDLGRLQPALSGLAASALRLVEQIDLRQRGQLLRLRRKRLHRRQPQRSPPRAITDHLPIGADDGA